jgi:hypothetical protein
MTGAARRPAACPDPEYSGRDLDHALDHPDRTRLARQVICSQVQPWESSVGEFPVGGSHSELWRKRSGLDREADGSKPH